MFYYRYNKIAMKTHANTLPLAFVFIFSALTFIFFPQEVKAAVLYDYSNSLGTYDIINAASGPNGFNYGESGGYGFEPPTMTGAFAYFKIQLASGTTCPARVGSNMQAYDSSGNAEFNLGTGTFDSADNTCTYSVSGTDVKMIVFSGGANTTNDGQVLTTVASTDLSLVNGNGGTVTTANYGFAFQLCDSGGCSGGFTPPTPDDTSTRIEWINPPLGNATTSTSTINFQFKYYLNSNADVYPDKDANFTGWVL